MLAELLDKLQITNPAALQVTTDSRNCPQGSVFFGLKGDRFDGNQYARQALINGASLVVVDDPQAVCCITPDKYLLVDNSLLALQALAREWREYINIPVIGITGTNGKTTTKELTAAVLQKKYHIHFTQGNLNNQIGVPLTLLQLNRSHEMAIVEMGASHPGDIKELVEIAEPQYGLITNIGMAHLQGFGSPEGVRRTKGELYDFLRRHNGHIFLNTNDPTLVDMAQGLPQTPYTELPHIQTNLIGEYNQTNIRAAVTIGTYFGVPLNEALQAVKEYQPSNNRSMFKQTDKNRLIVDAYNANVSSMKAAIDSFAASDYTDKMLILGDMLELGEYTETEHQKLVDTIVKSGFTNVYLVGENMEKVNTAFPKFNNVNDLAQYIKQHPVEGQTILIKGSRGIKLETLIPLL